MQSPDSSHSLTTWKYASLTVPNLPDVRAMLHSGARSWWDHAEFWVLSSKKRNPWRSDFFISARRNLSFSHLKVCVRWGDSRPGLSMQASQWQHTFTPSLGILFIITPGKISAENRISFSIMPMPHSSNTQLETRFVDWHSSSGIVCTFAILSSISKSRNDTFWIDSW